MPVISTDDLERMRRGLFFDGAERGRKFSRFWVLLVLAAAIASAGVVGDSTATVIGAMIVAPLMTPIMGTALAITISDRRNFVRSVAMVVAGAFAAIAVGYLFGVMAPIHVLADTSSQVASRINPRLIDLIAAIATGAVGAFAQCREDVGDTLPGVAIAISLVPPLTVVGLTLEGGAPHQARGAFLLFLTNVSAIILTGVIVMSIHRVHEVARQQSGQAFQLKRSIGVAAALVVAVAVPLSAATVSLTRSTQQRATIGRIAKAWVKDTRWIIVDVEPGDRSVVVIASGPLPEPDPKVLRQELDAAGLAHVDVTLHLIPEDRVDLPGS